MNHGKWIVSSPSKQQGWWPACLWFLYAWNSIPWVVRGLSVILYNDVYIYPTQWRKNRYGSWSWSKRDRVARPDLNKYNEEIVVPTPSFSFRSVLTGDDKITLVRWLPFLGLPHCEWITLFWFHALRSASPSRTFSEDPGIGQDARDLSLYFPQIEGCPIGHKWEVVWQSCLACLKLWRSHWVRQVLSLIQELV